MKMEYDTSLAQQAYDLAYVSQAACMGRTDVATQREVGQGAVDRSFLGFQGLRYCIVRLEPKR